MLRSRRCCHSAEAVCSCSGPVGRRSSGSMPLAARQTATSPMRAVLSDCPAPPKAAGCRRGRRHVECGRRGRRPAGTAGPGSAASRGDRRSLGECRVARAAVVGREWSGFWEAPVQDGGHVFSGAEIPPECGFIEVDERVLAGLCGQGDEVGSQGRPGRFVGDVRVRPGRLGCRASSTIAGPTICSAAACRPSV